jgi:hypothetical protein
MSHKIIAKWALGHKDVAAALKRLNQMAISFAKDPSSLKLDKRDAVLQPALKKAAKDVTVLSDSMLEIRDTLGKESSQYKDVNKVYRSVLARAVQQERRERAERAFKAAEAQYGECPSFAERLRWVAALEHEWAGQRMTRLEEFRRKATGMRLSRDETENILDQFWADIDALIDDGDVPPWS